MQLTIKLDDFSRRPIAIINWFKGCRAMIDTGALFPNNVSVYLAGTYDSIEAYEKSIN